MTFPSGAALLWRIVGGTTSVTEIDLGGRRKSVGGPAASAPVAALVRSMAYDRVEVVDTRRSLRQGCGAVRQTMRRRPDGCVIVSEQPVESADMFGDKITPYQRMTGRSGLVNRRLALAPLRGRACPKRRRRGRFVDGAPQAGLARPRGPPARHRRSRCGLPRKSRYLSPNSAALARRGRTGPMNSAPSSRRPARRTAPTTSGPEPKSGPHGATRTT